MNIKEAITPPGVGLYKFDDHDAHREQIYTSVLDTLKSTFPLEHNGAALHLEDAYYVDPPTVPIKKQKEAKLKGSYVSRRIKGTLVLKDAKTGQELSRKTTSLMRVPYLTQRGTFLHGGSDYYPIGQLRLLPGPYARVKTNGELETQINVKKGTGRATRLQFEPSTGLYRLGIGGARIHLYSVLHDIGVDDSELQRWWGSDLLRMNKEKYSKQALDSAYERLVPASTRKKNEAPTRQEKATAVRDALEMPKVSKYAVQLNLPKLLKPMVSSKFAAVLENTKAGRAARKEIEKDAFGDEYIPFGVKGLLAASEKLKRINKGEDDPDDRDSLRFKRLYRPANLLSERVDADAGSLRRKLMWRAVKTKNLDGVPPFYFDPYMVQHIIGSPLTTPLEETNPIQLEEHSRRMTMMGPGGVASSSAITDEAQAVHPSIFGFISPSEGPESERAGVDVRAVSGARAGTDGRLYQVFKDIHTGKYKWMSPEDVGPLTVKIPD